MRSPGNTSFSRSLQCKSSAGGLGLDTSGSRPFRLFSGSLSGDTKGAIQACGVASILRNSKTELTGTIPHECIALVMSPGKLPEKRPKKRPPKVSKPKLPADDLH